MTHAAGAGKLCQGCGSLQDLLIHIQGENTHMYVRLGLHVSSGTGASRQIWDHGEFKHAHAPGIWIGKCVDCGSEFEILK